MRKSWTHLEVTLVGVEDDWLFFVEYPLHLQGQSTNGRLEVRLLGVHHQPHPVLHSMLEHTRCIYGIYSFKRLPACDTHQCAEEKSANPTRNRHLIIIWLLLRLVLVSSPWPERPPSAAFSSSVALPRLWTSSTTAPGGLSAQPPHKISNHLAYAFLGIRINIFIFIY